MTFDNLEVNVCRLELWNCAKELKKKHTMLSKEEHQDSKDDDDEENQIDFKVNYKWACVSFDTLKRMCFTFGACFFQLIWLVTRHLMRWETVRLLGNYYYFNLVVGVCSDRTGVCISKFYVRMCEIWNFIRNKKLRKFWIKNNLF